MPTCCGDSEVFPPDESLPSPETTPNAWFKSLSDNEFRAGEFYKGTGYKSMNPALRGQGEMSDLMERRVADLDSALAKGALGKDTTLYRMAPQNAFGEIRIGSEFVDNAFISTSMKRKRSGSCV